MKYKFKIQEENKEIEEKEGMSYKKTLKSLVTPNQNGQVGLRNKNKRINIVKHIILER